MLCVDCNCNYREEELHVCEDRIPTGEQLAEGLTSWLTHTHKAKYAAFDAAMDRIGNPKKAAAWLAILVRPAERIFATN